MIGLDFSPVFLLRAYVWELLKANTNMVESDYGGLTPVLPVSQIPEVEQFNKPFLVYGFAIEPTEPERHYCQRGSMTFAIYSTNFKEITNIITILQTVFNEEDDAATNVNIWTSTIPEFIGIRFSTITVGFSDGPSPEESEGGRESGLVNIRFEYYVDYPVKTYDDKSNTWK